MPAPEPITAPVVTFVGDVHGWADRLERVLAQAEGLVVLLGDLVDRGPEADVVIDRVRALVESGRARCLMGNHEYALIKALGVPELGIPVQEGMYEAWSTRYGGAAVERAFGIGRGDAEGLRAALGDRLSWLARLPWVLEGATDAGRWIAVHAGLSAEPWEDQLPPLRDPWPVLRDPDPDHPMALYSKQRVRLNPVDLPADLTVVSGHFPLPEAHIAPGRILCDTSGGLPDRVLSAVVWPEGRVITS